MSKGPTISQQELRSVIGLEEEARYRYFVKRVADREAAWGLWKDGWVLAASKDGTRVLPLWPAREYAELCATGDWGAAEAEEISVRDLLDDLLPKLEANGILLGVFFVLGGTGGTLTSKKLREDLVLELQDYE
jgi:hypothetical protein